MAYTTIDDPSEYFHIQLYTGDANDNRNITNEANAGDFKPDWLWIKERNDTSSNQLIDSNRGTRYSVLSDSANAEDDDQNRVQSFLTDGFQVGTASTVNENNKTYVAWQWKVNGGTTTTTHSNSTTNKVDDNVLQVNTTAGIAIVTYTGVEDDNGNSPIFVHNLGDVAEMVWVKNRSQGDDWAVLHKDVSAAGATKSLVLNSNAASSTSPDPWDGNAGANNGVYVKGQPSAVHNVNADGESYVAYCFRSIQGYSKIGSYIGNGNANGTFVYTGFKPAFVLRKAANNGEQWVIQDTTRNLFNDGQLDYLYPSAANAETTASQLAMDILSNGFKCRSADGSTNGSDKVYIYMAFAEHPFVSSTGTPTTAR